MAVSSREEVVAAFDAFGDTVPGLADFSFEALTTPEQLALLERLEHDTRRLPVARHALINGVHQQASAAEIGGKLSHVLADRLGISRSEANRRIEEAGDLGERQALTGEPLPPRLSSTAAAQRQGMLGEAHVRVIRGFLHELPCWIDAPTRDHAEAQLAQFATQYRPELLASWPQTRRGAQPRRRLHRRRPRPAARRDARQPGPAAGKPPTAAAALHASMALRGHPSGAKNSSAMPSGSRKLNPDP
jgi:uncharacterized protein DUF222